MGIHLDKQTQIETHAHTIVVVHTHTCTHTHTRTHARTHTHTQCMYDRNIEIPHIIGENLPSKMNTHKESIHSMRQKVRKFEGTYQYKCRFQNMCKYRSNEYVLLMLDKSVSVSYPSYKAKQINISEWAKLNVTLFTFLVGYAIFWYLEPLYSSE